MHYVNIGAWSCVSHTDFILYEKEQFIFDLPTRLGKCIKSEAYADVVRFYTGAMAIFKLSLGSPGFIMVWCHYVLWL